MVLGYEEEIVVEQDVVWVQVFSIRHCCVTLLHGLPLAQVCSFDSSCSSFVLSGGDFSLVIAWIIRPKGSHGEVFDLGVVIVCVCYVVVGMSYFHQTQVMIVI